MFNGIVRIVDHFKSAYPDIKIILVQCPKFRLWTDAMNQKVDEYNLLLADKYKDNLISLQQLFDDENYIKHEYHVADDDIHLNEDGYKIFIKQLESVLNDT